MPSSSSCLLLGGRAGRVADHPPVPKSSSATEAHRLAEPDVPVLGEVLRDASGRAIMCTTPGAGEQHRGFPRPPCTPCRAPPPRWTDRVVHRPPGCIRNVDSPNCRRSSGRRPGAARITACPIHEDQPPGRVVASSAPGRRAPASACPRTATWCRTPRSARRTWLRPAWQPRTPLGRRPLDGARGHRVGHTSSWTAAGAGRGARRRRCPAGSPSPR